MRGCKGRALVRLCFAGGAAHPPGGGPGGAGGPNLRLYVPCRWSGLLRCLGAQRPGGPACPAGVPISPEKWGERGPGASPLDPHFYSPLAAARSFWGSLSLIRQRGYFLRYAKTDLGRIFRKKYVGKHFCERKFPNQGTQMGAEIAQRPEQCATTAKTSERERAGHKTGGPGGTAPGALSSGFLRRKPGSRPESGGNPRGRSGPAPVLTGPPANSGRGILTPPPAPTAGAVSAPPAGQRPPWR